MQAGVSCCAVSSSRAGSAKASISFISCSGWHLVGIHLGFSLNPKPSSAHLLLPCLRDDHHWRLAAAVVLPLAVCLGLHGSRFALACPIRLGAPAAAGSARRHGRRCRPLLPIGGRDADCGRAAADAVESAAGATGGQPAGGRPVMPERVQQAGPGGDGAIDAGGGGGGGGRQPQEADRKLHHKAAARRRRLGRLWRGVDALPLERRQQPAPAADGLFEQLSNQTRVCGRQRAEGSSTW